MHYSQGQEVSTAKAFAEALVKFGGQNKKVVVLDADSLVYSGTDRFEKNFPDRHFNFGNADVNMVTTAAGMAHRGKIPFACSKGVFITGRPWEQIRNSICYPNLNVKLIGTGAGLVQGEKGPLFQGLEDIAIMRVIPNMKVICPADAVETYYAIEECLKDFSPTYIRLSQMDLPVIYSRDHQFKIGYGDILTFGEDISLMATGTMVHVAVEVAKRLEKDNGLRAMVVNMPTIKPIDEKLVIECARKTRMMVTLEDHVIWGGLGSAVAEVTSEQFPVRVHKIGMEQFGETGKPQELYKKYALDVEGVYSRVVEWWKEKH
ncbi:transketolase family protein [Patescibacteria group bacterium]